MAAICRYKSNIGTETSIAETLENKVSETSFTSKKFKLLGQP